MNLRLNKGNFYLSSYSFQTLWLSSSMEVRKTYKFSTRYLFKLCLLDMKNTVTCHMNTIIVLEFHDEI